MAQQNGKPAGERKPNILVIWGDDIGIWNLSCYSSGMRGYHTPHIDRLANEGMRFTDSYGAATFTIDLAMVKMEQALGGSGH